MVMSRRSIVITIALGVFLGWILDKFCFTENANNTSFDIAKKNMHENDEPKTFSGYIGENKVGGDYKPGTDKPVKGAFVVLVRNLELYQMKESMQSIEDRFNRKHNYPYIFLNDKIFTNEFKIGIRAMTKASVKFGLIPKEHWSYPEFINQTFAKEQRDIMFANKVIYAEVESYHHMCRYNSGFFYRHPLLTEYDYYWRIEPSVTYTCDIDYDPFIYMKEKNIKYGFTIGMLEYIDTIPSLWDKIKKFAKQNTHFINKNNSLSWMSFDNGKTYSRCHFWSNFEIGDLNFFRSEEYTKYFDFLDREGGFFYERWGDAPVHSIAAAMFLPSNQIHYFSDIGYLHPPYQNCPQDPKSLQKCFCDPKNGIIVDKFIQCTKLWVNGVSPIPPNVFANS
ncbi:Glycolipid 2-alpha-mannosyltransferase 2 [Smittium mucronatum]|uniref:Glycolipid 2-alpha-mannosyltransferase 2 n=1 Tax=Smittium mucronatum TaxID=133383 RepID=A0A1R0GVL2_9FUNG|nr:Glycolipid 2-alpha-mannosyltransferase 2 [Smittium mucronatum]